MTPKFSVILPICYGSKFLTQALACTNSRIAIRLTSMTERDFKP
ncbi:MAG: hypothetical protein ABSC54_00390 [Smithellaceae bacterium]